MLFDPRTPLIIGILAILLFGVMLMQFSPMPAELSSAHAQIAETCQTVGRYTDLPAFFRYDNSGHHYSR